MFVLRVEPRRDGRYNLHWSDGDTTICDKNALWMYECDLESKQWVNTSV